MEKEKLDLANNLSREIHELEYRITEFSWFHTACMEEDNNISLQVSSKKSTVKGVLI